MMESNELEIKLSNGDKDFNEDQLKNLAWEYSYDTIEGDEGRWDRSMETIVKVDDRYFKVEWSRGLTESQEDSFFSQPVEVEMEVKEVLTTVVNYNTINKQ